MWKLLLIAFSARVSGGPLQHESPGTNLFNSFRSGVGTCHCLPLSTASDQISASQPFAISIKDANFYQNFILGSSHGPPNVPTREDYTYRPGVGSHKYHTLALTWNEARKSCKAEGAHLAIVNSVAEAQVLSAMMNNSEPLRGSTDPKSAFVGFHDLYKEGEYVTIFGDPLVSTGYEKWSLSDGGQPNDHGRGNENCGAIYSDAGLYDSPCLYTLAYFCERIIP